MSPASGVPKPKWLVFGIGNPSRGDDSLGSTLVDRLEQWLDQDGVSHSLPVEVIVQTDFQCQIEHALDLKDVATAVFVDASVACAPPFALTEISAEKDASHSTHALSPACVLEVARKLNMPLPQTWTMAIRGDSFELGEPLSVEAERNLGHAFNRLIECLLMGKV